MSDESVITKRAKMVDDVSVLAIPHGLTNTTALLAAVLLQWTETYGKYTVRQTRAKTNGDILSYTDACSDCQVEFFDELAKHKNIRLGSAGRIWLCYGKEILKSKFDIQDEITLDNIFTRVYRKKVERFDAQESGVDGCGCENHVIRSVMSAKHMYAMMDPSFDLNFTAEAREAALKKAMSTIVEDVSNYVVFLRDSFLPEAKIVREAFDARHDVHPAGQIIELTRFVPWRSHLSEIEEKEGIETDAEKQIHWILFQDDRNGQWRGTAVAESFDRFKNRTLIHPDLRGLRDQELIKASNVPSANFVHHSGFTGGASTREGMVALMQWKPSA